MSEISPLTEQDVCDIVRLLGEVAAMKPDANAQRIYLMEELAGLLGTDTWVWGVALLLHEVGMPHANSHKHPAPVPAAVPPRHEPPRTWPDAQAHRRPPRPQRINRQWLRSANLRPFRSPLPSGVHRPIHLRRQPGRCILTVTAWLWRPAADQSGSILLPLNPSGVSFPGSQIARLKSLPPAPPV